MYIIKPLHLNDFRICRIPSGKELFRSFGLQSPNLSGSATDFDGEPCNLVLSKLQSLELGQNEAVTGYLNHLDEVRKSQTIEPTPNGDNA